MAAEPGSGDRTSQQICIPGSKVFHTKELREHILRFCDAEELFRLRHVSGMFKHSIEATEFLAPRITLRSKAPDIDLHKLPLTTVSRDIVDHLEKDSKRARIATIHPLLFRFINDADATGYEGLPSTGKRWARRLKFRFPPLSSSIGLEWVRELQISQPPTCKVEVSVWAWAVDSEGRTVSQPGMPSPHYKTFENKSGITYGDLSDEVLKMLKGKPKLIGNGYWAPQVQLLDRVAVAWVEFDAFRTLHDFPERDEAHQAAKRMLDFSKWNRRTGRNTLDRS